MGENSAHRARHAIIVTVATVLALVGALFAAPISAQASAAVTAATAVAQILADTNALRAAGGLPPLRENSPIDVVAANWSAQMGASGNFIHNPNYSTQIPGGWTGAGENIAVGYSYTTVVDAWHHSAGHYANIMGDYTDIGIGYYVTSSGQTYYTQDFGKYPTASPAEASFVKAAYADVLGRSPGAGEVSGWTALLAGGTPRSAVASGFNNSDEYRLHMIDTAYLDVLSRPSESGGRLSWLNGMRSGALQPDDVHRIFLSTDEFYATKGGGTDAGYIQALYADIVGRPAVASEVTYWVGRLQQLGRAGVVNGFWFAAETINRQASELFTDFLGRTASTSEVATWASMIRGSGLTGSRNSIMSSAEYAARAVTRFP